MSLTLVLGAQWGDEGKGKLVDILTSPFPERPSVLREIASNHVNGLKEATPHIASKGSAADGVNGNTPQRTVNGGSHITPDTLLKRHPKIDVCARAAGGANAGHTIVAGAPAKTYHFHILPSGLLHNGVVNLIGSGCVINIPGLFQELDEFLANAHGTEAGATAVDRLLISDRAHVVTKMQLIKDGLEEEALGAKKVGTTKKGIGPTYSAKMARTGLRIADLFEDDAQERLRTMYKNYQNHLNSEQTTHYSPDEEWKEISQYLDRLRPLVVDATTLMHSLQTSPTPANMLIEGANALMLDIDYGTYPFVTSSSTGLGGVVTGLAINPRKITTCIGVVKAYTTRVGSGPFPSECSSEGRATDPEIGEELQRVGKEFGVTTGRRRRCGWLDLVVLRHSCIINHYDLLNLTKLDVLDGLSEIKVATAYKYKGTVLENFPASARTLDEVEIVYETLPGWKSPTTGARSWDDLPRNAQAYVEFIEVRTGVRVAYIGTGPSRDHMIWR